MIDVQTPEDSQDEPAVEGDALPDLANFSPELILSLQGTIGNQAVLQLLRQNSDVPAHLPFSFLRRGIEANPPPPDDVPAHPNKCETDE
jgi:hypothetical protein